MPAPSLLPLVEACQNDDPWADPTLRALRVHAVQIGFLPTPVHEAVMQFLAQHDAGCLRVDHDGGLTFAPHATPTQRSADMARLVTWMRTTRRFPDPLDGWRDEPYAVYGPGDASQPSAVAFTLERAACALFGLATFGVHMTVGRPRYA